VGHDDVQAKFAQLIGRRHRYPAAPRTVLAQNHGLRQIADYEPDHLTEIRAARAVRRSREFVDVIRQGDRQA